MLLDLLKQLLTEKYKYYCTTKTGKIIHVSNYGNMKVDGNKVDFSLHKYRRYYTSHGVYIHRAVAELFVPNTDNKPYIDHIDGNSKNNIYTNLRWVTQKENINNPITIQRMKKSQKGRVSPMLGRKHTEATKQLMSKHHKTKK